MIFNGMHFSFRLFILDQRNFPAVMIFNGMYFSFCRFIFDQIFNEMHFSFRLFIFDQRNFPAVMIFNGMHFSFRRFIFDQRNFSLRICSFFSIVLLRQQAFSGIYFYYIVESNSFSISCQSIQVLKIVGTQLLSSTPFLFTLSRSADGRYVPKSNLNKRNFFAFGLRKCKCKHV